MRAFPTNVYEHFGRARFGRAPVERSASGMDDDAEATDGVGGGAAADASKAGAGSAAVGGQCRRRRRKSGTVMVEGRRLPELGAAASSPRESR